MAGNSTISITFKLENDGSFKLLAKDAEGLKKVMAANLAEAGKLKSSLVNWSQAVQALGAVSNAVGNISNMLSGAADKMKSYQASFAQAAQLTGLTGDELRELRNSAQAVADTFGSDFTEVIQSANALAKGFGISAQDAMKLLQDGLVSGANANGEFLDTLREYPRYFKEAGISAEEFVAITTNAAKQGVYSDKGVDTIKEGNLRIREMTKATAEALDGIGISSAEVQRQLQEGSTTTFKVMQQVAEKLKELPASSSAVGTAIADIFGGPGEDAGLEYLKSLADIELSMDALREGADEYSKALGEQAAKQAGVSNGLSGIIDLTKVFAAIAPSLNVAAQLGMTVTGLTAAVTAFKGLNVQAAIVVVRSKAAAAACLLVGVNSSRAAVLVRVFSGALTTGAYSATAFKIALRGLLIATGVGAAIWAVTAIIEHFANANDDAAKSANGLTAAEERQRAATEKANAARQAEVNSINQAKAALELNIQKLKDFKGSKTEEKAIVEKLNNTYGNTMGYFKSVAEWYQALTKNSKAYCEQMVVEAKTRRYANQIAEIESNIASFRETGKLPDGSSPVQDYLAEQGVDAVTGAEGGSGDYWILEQERKVTELRKKMEEETAKLKDIKMPVIGSPEAPDLDTSKSDKKQKTHYQELGGLIDKVKEKYVTASTEERAELANKIAAWKQERSQIQLLQKQAEQPLNLNSLQDIDDAISYQSELRKTASKENVASIDAEIGRLEKLKSSIENAGIAAMPDSELSTYDQLNAKLSYYNELLQKATTEERPTIQKHINDIQEIKQSWDDALAALNKPSDISALNTIGELDEAVRYYQDLQTKQTATEIENTQRTIDALEAKRKAMQRGTELPSMQREIAQIGNLPDREFKLKIKAIGFDALTDKIRELRDMLNDTENPVTDGQRKEIEEMIAVYEQWRKSSVSAFDTMREGWSGIKGIGDSITSITDALEGDSNAWQKLTAIVDGFIQLYESISTMVGIINTLTAATIAHTTTKTEEAAATTAAATAQTAEASVATATAAATVPVIAANKLATASFMELASAAYFAAHASIPFAGFGIAAGYIAAATAVVQAIGVTPFAKGGVVSGPTLALVGEYAGASNNPEVIAPLDKLRGMLQPQDTQVGRVQFEIEGRKLVGVLNRENKLTRRS